MRFALLLFALPLGAQTFYGFAASALTSGHQQWTGSAVIATQLQKSQQIWSFSETDWIYAAPAGQSTRRLVSSVRTGLATQLRCFGTACLYGLADAGASSNGTTSGAAYAGGGVLLIPIKNRLQLIFGARLIKSNVSNTQATISVGLGGLF